MRQRQSQRWTAATRPQREDAGGAEADDRHHSVLSAAATNGVAMPGDAVRAVAVVAQPGGGEGLTQFAAVDVVEPPAHPRQLRMRRIFDGQVVKTHQPRHIDHPVVHLTALGSPRHRRQQRVQQFFAAGQPARTDVDKGSVAELSSLVVLEERALNRDIDQRGYGRSSKYRVQKAYRIKELVGDVVGVLDSYGAEQAFVVGHDWGAPVAWTFAWLHPDRCAGVVGISVPFAGRGVIGLPGSPFGERRPSDYHLELAGPGRVWYQDYFAVQDGIITEIEEDLRGWLLGLTYTVSGEGMMAATKAAVDAGVDLESMDPIDVIRAGPLCMAEGARLKDAFVYPETMPAWFTEADLDFYTGEFERSGFGGPLSFYHNIDNDWHDLADQQGKPLTPPALFIGGQYDVGTIWGAQAIERAHEVMPNYRGTHMIADVGHWIQQEAPEETNRLLLDFLGGLRP